MRLPIRFGIELELIGPDPDFMRYFFRKRFNRYLGQWSSSVRSFSYLAEWTVDQGGHEFGWEITTPAFRSLRGLDSLRPILQSLSEFCFINKHCGMHVHLSSDRRYCLDVDEFAAALWRRYGRYVGRGRRHYCVKGVGEPGDRRCHSVEVIYGNHVEVRLFNGTLDFSEVRSRVKFVTELYRHYLYRSSVGKEVARIRREKKKGSRLCVAA